MRLFKTKDYSKPERVKTVYGSGKKQSAENMIKVIRILFKLKKKRSINMFTDDINIFKRIKNES